MSEKELNYVSNLIASALLAGTEENNNILREEHAKVLKELLLEEKKD